MDTERKIRRRAERKARKDLAARTNTELARIFIPGKSMNHIQIELQALVDGLNIVATTGQLPKAPVN